MGRGHMTRLDFQRESAGLSIARRFLSRPVTILRARPVLKAAADEPGPEASMAGRRRQLDEGRVVPGAATPVDQ